MQLRLVMATIEQIVLLVCSITLVENNILHNQYLLRKELIDDIREAVSANIQWNDLL